MNRSWGTADDWMHEFITKLQRSQVRVANLRREVHAPKKAEVDIRDYDDETAQKLAFIRGREAQTDALRRLRETAHAKRAPQVVDAEAVALRALERGRPAEARAKARSAS